MNEMMEKVLQSPMEREVEEALQQLPDNVKRAYETAAEIVPELVKKESRISDYLRTESYNPERAALRLCRYWNYRKDLFGERWLLPLNQTGFGALSLSDLDFVRSGCHVVHTTPDGLVVVYDETRLPRILPDKGFTRYLFYLVTIHAADSQNVTFVYVITAARRSFVNVDTENWVLLRSALPMTIKQVLVAEAYEEGKEELIDFLGYQTSRLSEMKTKQSAVRLQTHSARGTLRLLEERGVPARCVPHSLGGQYNYSKFQDWIRMRLSVEDMAGPCPLRCYRPSVVPQVANITSLSRRGALVQQTKQLVQRRKRPAAAISSSSAAATATATQDDEKQLLREKNALYARRAYQKRKLELFSVQDQVRVWQTRNDHLRRQNADLEQQLAVAQQLVAQNME